MRKPALLFALFITAGVILAIAAAVSTMDNPQLARFKRLDEKRMQNLLSLSNAVNSFRTKSHKLPESLEQLVKDQGLAQLPLVDDQGRPYEYGAKTDDAYDLCATFDAASRDGRYPSGSPLSAKHPAGHYCFNFTTAR